MGTHSRKYLEVLFSDYIGHKCTHEEKQKFFELFIDPANETSFKEVLLSHLNEFRDDPAEIYNVDFDRISNQLLSEIIRREKRESEKRLIKNKYKIRRILFQGIAIAAVFCIAFLLGTKYNRQDKVIAPVYPAATSINEIKAPLGAKSEVKLSDGTEIMLNAGSSIKYRSDYNSLNRDLILEGEAYFKVAKNIDLPLVVFAGNLNIKATGTEFNVKAYSDEEIIETTLIEGKVEIFQKGDDDKDKILELEPNQKAIYASKQNQIVLEKIRELEPLAVKPPKVSTEKLLLAPKTDVEQVTAWTKNKLNIRSENLESLCIKLQRKYNVTFVFGDEAIKKHRFSGILLDETLQQVLNVIKLTAPVDYLLDGKTVLIFSNEEEAEKYSNYFKKHRPE